MGYYSIRDLEKLSGIKAHTIRMWEKRYQVLEPVRSETNIRSYDDEALKRLLNITTLIESGMRISKVARMSHTEVVEEINALNQIEIEHSGYIEQMIIAMIDMNEMQFEKLLSNAIIRHGLETCVLEIIYPFLTRTGVMWKTGNINPAQEHFISNLIRQKLIVAVDGQMAEPKENAKTFILFLPEGELHELGLLFYSYIVRNSGHKLVYLGQSLPYKDLKGVAAIHPPDFILTSLSPSHSAEELEELMKNLVKDFPKAKVLVSFIAGAEKRLSMPKGVLSVRPDDAFRVLLN